MRSEDLDKQFYHTDVGQNSRRKIKMRINHNMTAMNTYRQLTSNEASQSKTMEQLSTGKRINHAADDAAGLAISEKMRNQIRGLEQSSRNAQDGISLIQTGEGALNQTHDVLSRMRELAVQSANDTNTDQDRQSMQTEMKSLETQIDSIGNNTQFNSKNILDGSLMNKTTSTASVDTSGVLKDAGGALLTTTLLTDLTDANGNTLGIATGDNIKVSYLKDGKLQSNTVAVGAATDIATLFTSADYNTTVSSNQVVATAATAGLATQVGGITVTVTDSSGNLKGGATNALNTFNQTTSATDVHSDGRATIQLGANSSQNDSLEIGDMRSEALGVKNIDITTQDGANTAIKAIDSAISKVSDQLSNLGAMQNSFQYSSNNMDTQSQNLTAAQSRITDVDMAQAVMENSKNGILVQAAQAMLGQANQQPQGVLQLLRG